MAVELDGGAWRTLPVEVVARAGLACGLELDRERLRVLRRELRRNEAMTAAARALTRRDLSERRLDQRLERLRISPAARGEALGTLARAGLVDDARFARSRAEALAERGYGDAAIRFDLGRQGLGAEEIEQALAGLDPETKRAERVVASLGTGPKTARTLARRGFGEDAVEAAARAGVAEEP